MNEIPVSAGPIVSDGTASTEATNQQPQQTLMAPNSNPHVKERSAYSSDDQMALLEAIRDAGAGGIAVSELFGPYGGRREVLGNALDAFLADYIDLQWSATTDVYGLVIAEDRLRKTDSDDLQNALDTPTLR